MTKIIMLKILLIATFLGASLEMGDKMADISFLDKNGQKVYKQFQYFVKPDKTQYGVKFGVDIYNIKVTGCQAIMVDNLPEYFAAYVLIPQGCSSDDIVREVVSHGADFLFLGFTDPLDI